MPTTWGELVAHAVATYPDTHESTSYGTPALKVRGALVGRLRTEAEGLLALKCGLDEKAALVEGDDPAFRTLPHYDEHAFVLVDLDLVETDQLHELLTEAWLRAAPPRARRAWEG